MKNSFHANGPPLLHGTKHNHGVQMKRGKTYHHRGEATQFSVLSVILSNPFLKGSGDPKAPSGLKATGCMRAKATEGSVNECASNTRAHRRL